MASFRRITLQPVFLLLIATFVCLYCNLFRFPFTPIWGGFPQFTFVFDSTRLWAGQRIYLDFSEITPPGIEVVQVMFFRVFGLRDWMPNVDLLMVGFTLTALVAFISRKMIRAGQFLALLPPLLFLAFGFMPVAVDSHRWFSSAASLAALAIVIERRTTKRLALAGMFCGIASFFTQTQGIFAAVGLLVFVLWEEHTEKSGLQIATLKSACLVASLILTVLITDAYFIWKAGFEAFFNCLVRYPAVYAPREGVEDSFRVYLSEIPHGMPLARLILAQGRYFLIHALVPFIYLFALLWSMRKSPEGEERNRSILLSVMGLSFFAGVAPSPSYFRLCTVSAPALILLVYFLRRKQAFQRVMLGLLWAATLFGLVHHPIQMQTETMRVLQLPRGPIAFRNTDSVDRELLDWLSSHTRPNDLFFIGGTESGILFPLALRPLDEATADENNGATRPDHPQSVAATLEAFHVRFIELWPDQFEPNLYRVEGEPPDFLMNYLRKNYRPVRQFGGQDDAEIYEIWQRIE
jgi:hypothetical protein